MKIMQIELLYDRIENSTWCVFMPHTHTHIHTGTPTYDNHEYDFLSARNEMGKINKENFIVCAAGYRNGIRVKCDVTTLFYAMSTMKQLKPFRDGNINRRNHTQL